MQVQEFGSRRWSRSRLAMLLAVIALLASSSSFTQAGGIPTYTISGRVTRDSASGDNVAGARIVATREGAASISTETQSDGTYTMQVPEGQYTLNVRAQLPTTVSPNWVANAAPILIAAPPNQVDQNFVVANASVTLNGALDAPGSATFATGNRAYVRAENQEGQGNTVQVNTDGTFSVRAMPGAILLSISLENQDWASATRGLIFFGEAGQTIAVQPNPILIQEKLATINGQVQVRNPGGGTSPAPQCIPVRAWRLDGAIYEDGFTDASGNYSLNVISGTWIIRAVPQPDKQYGAPVITKAIVNCELPTGTTYYVPAESPKLVELASDTTTISQNLSIATADMTVNGSTVDASGTPVTNADADGRVYSRYFVEGKPVLGPTAALSDGTFTNLRLSSTLAVSYTVGIYFPPDAPYTALARNPLSNLAPGSTTNITLPIAIDNSHITGALLPRGGAAYPEGLNGVVWGASNSGGWARTRVNPANGTYDLSVASTNISGQGGSTWRVRAFVDPVSGYFIQRPREQRVFLPYNNGSGSTVGNVNFTLLQPETFGEISGVVTAPPITPNGQPIPLAGVRVEVRELTGDGTTAIVRWELTNLQGRYRVHVPAGTYRIAVAIGGPRNLTGERRLIPPAPTTTTLAGNGVSEVNLRFRVSDAVVVGQLTYNGAPHAGLLRARSSDGAVERAEVLANGEYRLRLRSGLTWTLEAVGSEGSLFLKSASQQITPVASLSPQSGPTLVLESVSDIPERQFFTFAADTDQTFTMGNGAQVQVPAFTMASDARQILLTVRPLPELSGDGSVTPVAFGYRLEAFDLSERRPITHFLEPVTLIVPFTAEQLRELGVTPDRLVPSYWDSTTASWRPVENVSVNVDANGDGTVNIAVEHFTDFALLAAPGSTINLPLIGG